MTLYGRVVESQRRDALVQDPMAAEMMERIDCDWSAFAGDWVTQVGVAVRTEILDEATRAFLSAAPDATIVNIGAGLCTRYYRVDNGRMRWTDLDLPAVIDLKRELVTETARYRLLGASVLEPGWMDGLAVATREPLLFIAEGVLQYLDPSEIHAVLGALSTRFPGAEMLFDASSPAAVALSRLLPSLRRTGARPRWGYRGPARLEGLSPSIRVVREWRYDRHLDRWRWIRGIRWLPGVTNLMRVVHVRFVGAGAKACGAIDTRGPGSESE
jgi:O-methyltransferase involved in polyketide biosynthesis